MKTWQKIFKDETLTMVKTLELVRRKGPMSQVDIAKNLKLTRASINVHVKKLLEKGIVKRVGRSSNSTGRPQTLLDIDRLHHAVIGIVLSPPSLSAALSNFSGDIVKQDAVNVGHVSSLEQFEAQLVKLVGGLLDFAKGREIVIEDICFSTGGVLDDANGKVLNHVNFPTANGLNAHELLYPLAKAPVHVLSLGQAMYWGAIKEEEESTHVFHCLWDIGVAVSLGVGYDVSQGDYYRDSQGFGRGIRDMGHVIWQPGGRECHCGQKGCLEAYVGGWAVVERFKEINPDYMDLDYAGFLDLARKGNIQAKEMIKQCAREMAMALGWIFTVHRPCKVKISGNICDLGPWVFAAFKEGLTQRVGEEVAREMAPEAVYDIKKIQLLGACRLASHLKFNMRLLPMVRGTDDSKRTLRAVLK